MRTPEPLKNQLRSIIQWNDPQPWEIFRRFTDRGDELKNASKLILHPGQGCIFTYEGKIQSVFEEEGMYDIQTSNKSFITTLKKFMNAFESEHKAGLWFYRKADIVNVRWGTRVPITYKDPEYGFPVDLCGYGNLSIRIASPEAFFSNIVGGKENYYANELQELFLSRISQPISVYLANAKFSYAEIDSHIENIATEVKEKTASLLQDLGFQLLDFRIEGTSFTPETNERIAGISDTQAEVKAAKLAGLDYAEYQKLKALRDSAKNEGTAGAAVGMFTGANLGNIVNQDGPAQAENIKSKLKLLKESFDEGLIDEGEYKQKKEELLAKM